MQYFPKYVPEGSKLENLTINDSQIRFEPNENYSKLKSLVYLDLSFNNIDTIPNEFRIIHNLKLYNL